LSQDHSSIVSLSMFVVLLVLQFQFIDYFLCLAYIYIRPMRLGPSLSCSLIVKLLAAVYLLELFDAETPSKNELIAAPSEVGTFVLWFCFGACFIFCLSEKICYPAKKPIGPNVYQLDSVGELHRLWNPHYPPAITGLKTKRTYWFICTFSNERSMAHQEITVNFSDYN